MYVLHVIVYFWFTPNESNANNTECIDHTREFRPAPTFRVGQVVDYIYTIVDVTPLLLKYHRVFIRRVLTYICTPRRQQSKTRL